MQPFAVIGEKSSHAFMEVRLSSHASKPAFRSHCAPRTLQEEDADARRPLRISSRAARARASYWFGKRSDRVISARQLAAELRSGRFFFRFAFDLASRL